MKKIITFVLVMALCTSFVMAERIQGNLDLTWQNYGEQPQHFAGTSSGDLEGTIDLIANVDYDSNYGSIGVTNAEITGNLNGIDCEGNAVLTNINYGTDKGTFFLSCGDDLIQGIIYGQNGQDENGDWTLFNLNYDGFKVVPIVGPQGPQGEQGVQGETGLPGRDGYDGSDGYTPIKGVDYFDGINGIDGKDGVDGLPGVTGSCTCDLTSVNSRLTSLESVKTSYFNYNPDFFAYFTNGGSCTNGLLKCSGNTIQKCINYAWVNQNTCSYQCSNGACIDAPVLKDDCTTKVTYSCMSSVTSTATYKKCATGQGTDTSCNVGKCTGSMISLPFINCNTVTQTCIASSLRCKSRVITP